MRPVLRSMLLIWLVWHLFVMSVDLAKHVSKMVPRPNVGMQLLGTSLDSWSTLRPYTEWYQWRIGVHQNWSMFVPNPRLSTTWLEVEGVEMDRTTVVLPLIVGEPGENIWSYARAGKHERNALASHRKRLRMSYTRYYCRRAVEEGRPLKAVNFYTVSQRTPPPQTRGTVPREKWPRSRRKIGGWNCPR